MSEIEIIMGLSKSGKTRFLNTYLEMTCVKNERILIILVGDGSTNVKNCIKDVFVKIKVFSSIFEIDVRRILYLINIYRPHRILIEGDYLSVKKICMLIESDTLKDILLITSRIHLINSKFISKILKYDLIRVNSNIVIINNFDKIYLNSEDIENIKMRYLNSFLFCIEDFNEIYFKFKYYGLIKSDFQKNIFKYLKEYI